MMEKYFLAAILVIWTTSVHASDVSKACNVNREGMSPLYARECVDIGQSQYLVKPCSNKLKTCISAEKNISKGAGCGDSSPTTPALEDILGQALSEVAAEKKAEIINLDLPYMGKKISTKPGIVYLLRTSSRNDQRVGLSNAVALENGSAWDKKMTREVGSIKSLHGWRAFLLEGRKVMPVPVLNFIPHCDSSEK